MEADKPNKLHKDLLLWNGKPPNEQGQLFFTEAELAALGDEALPDEEKEKDYVFHHACFFKNVVNESRHIKTSVLTLPPAWRLPNKSVTRVARVPAGKRNQVLPFGLKISWKQ